MTKSRGRIGSAYRFWSWHWSLKTLALAILAVGLCVAGYGTSSWYAFRDRAPDRGAVSVARDAFGDTASLPEYRDQGWSPADSLWFYNTTQGSDFLPYDVFLALEQPDGSLLRANENMNNRYRYLARHPTLGNPDGLPIGIVKNTYKSKDYLGFTCAACHTGQINYKGHAIRIDGAPAMADMDSLITDLGADLRRTADAQHNPALHARFIDRVWAGGHYKSKDDIEADLKRYALRVTTYHAINHSTTQYGYARLDAFGRIYNKVLENVLTVSDIKDALNELIAEGRITEKDLDDAKVTPLLKQMGKEAVLTTDDRDQIIERLAGLGTKAFFVRDQLFVHADAPVSYPFLWDIPQHDYLQWNGIAPNAGLGPLGRNTGEVIGVFGTMDWSKSDHWTLAGVLSGQGLTNTHPIDFSSSVNVHKLALIEDHLKTLRAPAWPGDLFGAINYTDPSRPLWQRGKVLFNQLCASCHAPIDPKAADRRVIAHMSAQDNVKTDPAMAENSVAYQGYSGILRNQYASAGLGNVLLGRKAAVAALLGKATMGVIATPDPDKNLFTRFIEWAYDLMFSLRNNDIQPSLKNGDYHPDTTAEPFASVVAYKGRSLDGIWATAPYLHNGSVPTLYDLLLPASPMRGDPPGTEYRPTQFMLGSREFDPNKVGFRDDVYGGKTGDCGRADAYVDVGGYRAFTFCTNKPGNSNAGHEYGTRVQTTNPDGSVTTAPMSKAQRLDLLEYLKSL